MIGAKCSPTKYVVNVMRVACRMEWASSRIEGDAEFFGTIYAPAFRLPEFLS